eukprot:276612-Prorocentrum_minimum.AAC.1
MSARTCAMSTGTVSPSLSTSPGVCITAGRNARAYPGITCMNTSTCGPRLFGFAPPGDQRHGHPRRPSQIRPPKFRQILPKICKALS